MNKILMNRRYVADNVLTFVQTHGEVFKDDPQYQTLRLELEQRVEELRSMQTDLEILKMPLSDQKARAKREFLRKMDKLSKLLLSHASRTQLDQVLNFLSGFKSRLSNSSVIRCLALSQELLETARTYSVELESMSRGKQTLEEAEAALTAYSVIAQRPGQRSKEHSNLLGQFKTKLNQCLEFIRIDIQTFFYTWEEEHNEVYQLFLSFLDQPDYGKRYEEEEDAITDDPSSDDLQESMSS